jgi:hypothetical protein
MEHNYMIDASGSTIEAADKSLDSKKDSLISKLEKAKVGISLKVVETVYKGEFKYSHKRGSAKCDKTEKIETTVGWHDIVLHAGRELLESKDYERKFYIQQSYHLTSAQKTALEPKRTPAGRLEERTSDFSGKFY